MGERFPYQAATNDFGEKGLVPSIPITLSNKGRSLLVNGLIDTGAAVNVLPYSVGIRLGYIWDRNKPSLRLAGNLGRFDAQGILIQATVASLPTVELAFAWSEVDQVPLLLDRSISS